VGWWSPIGSTRHCGHQLSIVPAPGDYDDGEIGWLIGPKYSEKTCPSAALSTTKPTYCPDSNPGRRGGKSATNRLSYGTAFIRVTAHAVCFNRFHNLLTKLELLSYPALTQWLCVFCEVRTETEILFKWILGFWELKYLRLDEPPECPNKQYFFRLAYISFDCTRNSLSDLYPGYYRSPELHTEARRFGSSFFFRLQTKHRSDVKGTVRISKSQSLD
jgi:hypothetical protein